MDQTSEKKNISSNISIFSYNNNIYLDAPNKYKYYYTIKKFILHSLVLSVSIATTNENLLVMKKVKSELKIKIKIKTMLL